MDIIFILIFIIIFTIFVIILIDLVRYLINEFEYANQIINFDEYYQNWGMWLKYTLLGNIVTLIEKIYNKIRE